MEELLAGHRLSWQGESCVCACVVCVPAVVWGTFLKSWPSSVIKLDQMWFFVPAERQTELCSIGSTSSRSYIFWNCWFGSLRWCGAPTVLCTYCTTDLKKLDSFSLKFSLFASNNNDKQRMYDWEAASPSADYFHFSFMPHLLTTKQVV